MSDGLRRKDILIITGVAVAGFGVLAGALGLLLRTDGALEQGSITAEQSASLDQRPVESISPDAKPNAVFELHHRLEDGEGGLLVTGIVRNTSATFVERPELFAVCKDGAGVELSRASGRAEREVLLPAGTTPVKVLVPGGASCAELSYELEPRRPDQVAVYAPGLRVDSRDLRKSGADTWEITGTIRNDGHKRARYVQVQVLALDAVERIVGVDTVYARGDLLAPGGEARFRAGPLHYLKAPDHFEFTAYGRAAD